jgi:hypothetical protein
MRTSPRGFLAGVEHARLLVELLTMNAGESGGVLPELAKEERELQRRLQKS